MMTSPATKRRRTILKRDSNNPRDRNKNICTLAICQALGVDHRVRFLHTLEDMLRALRTRYVVRSRRSSIKGKTVGAVRSEVENLGALYYLVGLDQHVLLLGYTGDTLVDTNDRKGRDCRRIQEFYGIFMQKGSSFRV